MGTAILLLEQQPRTVHRAIPEASIEGWIADDLRRRKLALAMDEYRQRVERDAAAEMATFFDEHGIGIQAPLELPARSKRPRCLTAHGRTLIASVVAGIAALIAILVRLV